MSRYQRTMRDALQSVADGQMEFDEAVKWEVKISGLPTFYADGKSRGEVKTMLRKLLKRPDEIVSIERTTPAQLKQIRRGQAAGKEPGEDEEVKEGLLLEDNRIVKVKNRELTVDDIVNMIQFGKPFTVVDEDIPATLPPGDPNFPRYKDIPNSVVDKEDKKANKAKARAERDILIPTQTQEGIASGAGKVVGGLVGGALGLGVNRALGVAAGGGIMKAGAALQRKIDKRKEKLKKETYDTWFEASNWAKSKEDERKDSERLAKQQAAREKRHLKITRAGKLALKKGDHQLSITPKGRAALEKDKRNQDKDPVGKQHEGTDTWDPDPKKDKVTKHQARLLPTSPKKPIIKPRKSKVDFKDLRPQYSSEDSQDLPGLGSSRKAVRTSKRVGQITTGAQVKEVAPPGWGHTVPDKPKGAKVGGSIQAMKKAQERGDIPKKLNIFALAWSMKNKDAKAHYKPGERDVLKKKYKGPEGQNEESVLDSAKRYLDNG